MAIELTDDGTMDTVLRCSECGEEMRYNYDPCGTEERAAELTEEIARTNPHWKPNQVSAMVDRNLYEDFIDWAIEDATADHECPCTECGETECPHAADDDAPCQNDPDAEPTEPQEDDITTQDHKTFYQSGKLVLSAGPANRWDIRHPSRAYLGEFATCDAALRAYMELSQFWPNVWFISDHGNAHLMTLTEEK